MNNPLDMTPIKNYFRQCIEKHGVSPRGSDWNGEFAQHLRYQQLLKITDTKKISLIDFGCGYGALADYLAENNYECEYFGYDMLESVIEVARQTHATKPWCTFSTHKASLPPCDYVVASGTFNYRHNHSFKAWTNLVVEELTFMNQLARKGFSSNFLTKYSDAPLMRRDLYYADPMFLFDYCMRNFSRNVALLSDYGLYDFTLLVRKDI